MEELNVTTEGTAGFTAIAPHTVITMMAEAMAGATTIAPDMDITIMTEDVTITMATVITLREGIGDITATPEERMHLTAGNGIFTTMAGGITTSVRGGTANVETCSLPGRYSPGHSRSASPGFMIARRWHLIGEY